MRKPEFYAAVFGIIRNEKGEILFSRRHNTGHLDGYLSLPAGHVEYGETCSDAIIRELQEAIGITPQNMHPLFFQQSINLHDKKTYFNVFFEISQFTGEIQNKESDKCSELIFMKFSEMDTTNEQVVPYVQDAIQEIEKHNYFSEIIMGNEK